MGVVGGIVREGISRGDLCLPNGMNAEELVFGLWSLANGAYSLIASSEPLEELGISEPFFQVRRHLQTLMDGYQFKPLAVDHDYLATVDRINEKVFQNESERIAVSVD